MPPGSITRRALVVVDVQQEYFDGVLEMQHPPTEESLPTIRRALDVATEHDLPVVVVQHELPEGAPAFAHGRRAGRCTPTSRPGCGRRGSVSPRTRPASSPTTTSPSRAWSGSASSGSTAAAAEALGLEVELLSDATGAIHLANEVGSASARQVHETLMVLMHSNFAAVATTQAWVAAVTDGGPLPGSDLGSSAVRGAGGVRVSGLTGAQRLVGIALSPHQ